MQQKQKWADGLAAHPAEEMVITYLALKHIVEELVAPAKFKSKQNVSNNE